MNAKPNKQTGLSLDDLLSVDQAARALDLKRDTIYRYFRRKLLSKVRHGASVWVHRDEVARYLRERREPGRPKPVA